MNLNASRSPFDHIDQIHKDRDQPCYLVDSSSSTVSCHIFFNSAQDHARYYHPMYQPMHHDQEVDNFVRCSGGSSCATKNKVESRGLKLTLWKKEKDHDPNMKNDTDRVKLKIVTNKLEDQNNSDLSSCSSSYNNPNSPIRVCSDCNTTKTPLWRSGPKGPKSLCNACGIRQRKARRAAAAAAAAANGTAITSDQPPVVKVKAQHSNKEKNIKNGRGKRYKINVGAPSSNTTNTTSNKRQKLMTFEDFLVNLNNKLLAFHRVFPEEEKDAAILLMALSSGLVHG